MALLDVLGNVLAGGATGLIGSVLTTGFNFFNQKQKDKQELAMKSLDHSFMVKEAEIGMLRDEAVLKGDLAKLDAKMEEVELDMKKETIKQNAKDKLTSKGLEKLLEYKGTRFIGAFIGLLFGIVDIVKALIRPSITIYMLILTTIFYLSAKDIVDAAGIEMSVEESLGIMRHIVYTGLYITTTVIFWWFGERGPARQAALQNKWK